MSNIPMKDKNGKLLMSDEEQKNRWIEHFRDILNQPHPPQTYNFDDEREAIGAVDELDANTGDISVKETVAAIRSLRNKKAPGIDQELSCFTYSNTSRTTEGRWQNYGRTTHATV
ncbi:hypothetical protein Y032_0010g1037 [Ancylostoma ceylanicum]|uniref:Uncharacterized protein n=1 Tax=Ancylostoma ceylanicum TaxID=53326 RepID=A0A016VHJ0_9BILA|nr:hypothetical protein Y032_0010g1037 [Ancylostoma ceylanicum]